MKLICEKLEKTFTFLFILSKNISLRFRNSHRRCSVKKRVLKNCAIFTKKHPRWSLFLRKLQRLAALFKKKLKNKCFPVSTVKFLRNNFFKRSRPEVLSAIT